MKLEEIEVKKEIGHEKRIKKKNLLESQKEQEIKLRMNSLEKITEEHDKFEEK